MLVWIAGHLIGTKVGRGVLYSLIVIVLFLVVVSSIFRLGKNSEKYEQKLRELDALKKKVEVDHELRSLSPDDRRSRLRKWVRPD